MSSEGSYCRHGRSECECLDLDTTATDVNSGKVIAFHMPPEKGIEFDALSATNTVLYTSSVTSAPNALTGGWQLAQGGSINGITFPQTPDPPCAQIGHVIPNERNAFCTDDEGVVCGICSVCMQTVRFPGGIKAFDFERAGIMLGRAIGVDLEDAEKVGEILADLTALENEIDAQVARFTAAKELLELGRGSVQMRMRRDTASGVDAV